MSLFPRLQRLLATLTPQPKTVRRTPISRKRGKINHSYHTDSYAFGPETLQLMQEIEQHPEPFPSEWEPAFGVESVSAAATLRHRRFGKVRAVGAEYFSRLPRETYSFGRLSGRMDVGSKPAVVRLPTHLIDSYDFSGYSGRPASANKQLSPLEKAKLEEEANRFDFGAPRKSSPAVRFHQWPSREQLFGLNKPKKAATKAEIAKEYAEAKTQGWFFS